MTLLRTWPIDASPEQIRWSARCAAVAALHQAADMRIGPLLFYALDMAAAHLRAAGAAALAAEAERLAEDFTTPGALDALRAAAEQWEGE